MDTHVVLFGLLCLFDLCIGQGVLRCNPELQENRDYLGKNIILLPSPDVNHCQLLCTQHPNCQFFSYVRADSSDEANRFHCNLRTGLRKKVKQPGVTSGFSLKACSPDPEPCLSQLYHGVSFSGADYQTLFTSDYESCQRVCTNDPYCRFFTFFNESFETAKYRYKCHLKYNWNIPRTPFVKKLSGLVSGYSQKLIIAQPVTACEVQLFTNAEILGNHTRHLLTASPEHCHALCTAHPQCTYFVYDSEDYKCYLKDDPNEMVMRAKDGVTSGISASFCQHENNWAKKTTAGVDFWGADLDDLLADDAEGCQRACTENPHCQFFSYVTKTFSNRNLRRICYLKSSITLPVPYDVSNLANAVSGFSLRSCALSTIPEVQVPGSST
ncbi:coagulation factor XI-like [Cheilinus undulatus]|uniref:coagulation factor XI-like n=1 Tax=Cheilinus undulatus TaxID=241271 RepID=UPI001BD209F5|nr:coagulation factor XI-like [Cheilinus undulatus]